MYPPIDGISSFINKCVFAIYFPPRLGIFYFYPVEKRGIPNRFHHLQLQWFANTVRKSVEFDCLNSQCKFDFLLKHSMKWVYAPKKLSIVLFILTDLNAKTYPILCVCECATIQVCDFLISFHLALKRKRYNQDTELNFIVWI